MAKLCLNSLATRYHQTGAMVLVSVVLMLVMITLVTLYTGRIQSFEHKIALNGQNHQLAFIAASAGLAQGLAELQQNKSWWQATINGVTPNQQTFSVTATEQKILRHTQTISLFELTSRASSEDGLSVVSLSEQAIVYPLLVSMPAAPLLVDGGLDVRTTFELVANPNGAGKGLPLSLWTNGSADMSRIAGISCGKFEYNHHLCQSRAYSRQGQSGADILFNDPDFPADVLAYLFNIPAVHFTTLREEADLLLTDCNSLVSQHQVFIWVSGDCDIKTNSQLGSVASPVIIVIEQGNLHLSAGVNISGLLVFFKDPAIVTSYDIDMDASSVITGALAANQPLGRLAGNVRVEYEHNILQELTTHAAFMRVARVPGSWRDL